MKPGSQHLFTLGLKAEGLMRASYQADAYIFANEDGMGEAATRRALSYCDEINETGTMLREARGEETAADAFAKVLAGKSERIAKPGQWVVYREGGKVICEVKSDEA